MQIHVNSREAEQMDGSSFGWHNSPQPTLPPQNMQCPIHGGHDKILRRLGRRATAPGRRTAPSAGSGRSGRLGEATLPFRGGQGTARPDLSPFVTDALAVNSILVAASPFCAIVGGVTFMDDNILKLLRRPDYAPSNIPELLRRLGLRPNDQQALQQALRASKKPAASSAPRATATSWPTRPTSSPASSASPARDAASSSPTTPPSRKS